MRAYGLVFLLLSLSLPLIPEYSETQTAGTSNNTSSEQSNQLLEKQFFKTGNTLFDQRKYTDAITYYDKALQINSTDINVLYNKALALDNLGRLNEAITYYDKVLAIKPDDIDTLNNKGLALDSLGKHNEAITYYDKILDINPNDTDALYNKGLALDSLGKHDEAISYYDKVLEIDPADIAALNKKNLTFNNVNKNEMSVFQKIDQTTLIVVFGFSVSLVAGIIVIGLATRKNRKHLQPQVVQISDQIKKEGKSTRTEIQRERPKLEEIKDDGWGGI